MISIMDSSEYPQLVSLKGVSAELGLFDLEFGENVTLGEIFDGYMRYFRDSNMSFQGTGLVFHPEDRSWGSDPSDPTLVSVVSYHHLSDTSEFRLSFFTIEDYMDYLDMVDPNSELDASDSYVPEFVFSLADSGLKMELVLRNVIIRDQKESLVRIVSGKAQALDRSVSALLPLVQKIWKVGSECYLKASFSNN